MKNSSNINFAYGHEQQFRFRYEDINVIGSVSTEEEVARSTYSLNNGEPVHMYVEPKPTDKEYPWNTKTPGVHRLRDHLGWFNIEIPVSAPGLRVGQNLVDVEIRDVTGDTYAGRMSFDWDPEPVQLPLIIDLLEGVSSVQEIGQAVNGVFEVDQERNSIRTVAPSAPDALLLLGSPGGSQEALYDLTFQKLNGVFLGLSDFFVRHEQQSESLGIKPGYSTNGLATLRPDGSAQAWLARGDCLVDKDWAWVLHTKDPPSIWLEPLKTYRVRHQSIFCDGVNHTRFRIWAKDTDEPTRWLCHLANVSISSDKRQNAKSSFGLFKYSGGVTEWSNIEVRSIENMNLDLDEPVERSSPIKRKVGRLKSKLGSVFGK